MQVSRANGWTYDTVTHMLSWPTGPEALREPVSVPDLTLGAWVYAGLGYHESQGAARTVNDVFKRAWAEAQGVKVKDVPKGTKFAPEPDSDEYRAELLKAHADLYAKFVAGYEIGAREGSGDSVEEEVNKLGRMWLQGLATQFTHEGKPWYTLPSKKKVAADSDPYNGPGYATFGEALAAFIVSTKPVTAKLVGKTSQGAAWPWKMRLGTPVGEAILHEATRRVEERNPVKPGVALGGAGEDADGAF